MIKRVSKEQRKELRRRKENKQKLDRLIRLLIQKGIITKEEIE